jgi:heme-degrading monooxygenase HmoA
MVITVFRSRLRQDHAHEFHVLANRMLTLARTMPGFVSYKSFASDDGERCSIIVFESPEHLRAWREHPEHRQAQELGRERFYAEYSLHVAELAHQGHFRHEPA